eukprot:TRINITY_DN177_c2_g1_i1.p1 TRINITY_DN177_c2_g1~~TRINITY_DN177_c2_g1_i1.p1  ORF type:complete len:1077 (+),score=299.71 TRINITY_DN177_c2_g1_i1:1082-4312(+)
MSSDEPILNKEAKKEQKRNVKEANKLIKEKKKEELKEAKKAWERKLEKTEGKVDKKDKGEKGEKTPQSLLPTSVAEEEGSLTPSYDQSNPFVEEEQEEMFQAGGHGGVERTVPGLVRKRTDKAECDFYLTLQTTSLIPQEILSFFPKLDSIQKKNDGIAKKKFVVMEDLTHGLKRPCIMDVKMGTRTAGKDANIMKRKYMISKDNATTTSSLGMRLVASRKYMVNYNDFESLSRSECNSISTEGQLEKYLRSFFYNGEVLRTDVISPLLERLVTLQSWVSTQNAFRFYSSSLLFVYEGDPDEEMKWNLKMIDFAHVFEIKDGGIDEGYALGLSHLIRLFRRFLDPKIPPLGSTLPTSSGGSAGSTSEREKSTPGREDESEKDEKKRDRQKGEKEKDNTDPEKEKEKEKSNDLNPKKDKFASFNFFDTADPCALPLIPAVGLGHDVPVEFEFLSAGDYAVKTVSQMRSCLSQFPFNATKARKTVESLIELTDYYAFVEENLDSGEPYELKFDFKESLRDILNTKMGSFSYDYQFQHYLQWLFNNNKDGHTRYDPAQGTASSYFIIHPLRMYGKGDENELKFYVKGDITYGVHDMIFDFSDDIGEVANPHLVDMEIVKIDGIPPFEYMEQRAREYPECKDHSLNLNMELFHTFNYRNVQELPKNDYVSFTIVNPEQRSQVLQLNVAYLVLDRNLAFRQRLQATDPIYTGFNQYCAQKDAEARNRPKTQKQAPFSDPRGSAEHHPHLNKLRADYILQKLSEKHVPSASKRTLRTSENLHVIVNDKATRFSVSAFKNSTMVLNLPSFAASPQNENMFWLAPLHYLSSHGHKYDKLIIDIRDNTGGYVCLGRALAAWMTGMDRVESRTYHDVRATPLMKKHPILSAGCLGDDSKSCYLLSDILQYSTPVQHTRGGVDVFTTPKYHLDCTAFFQYLSLEMPFKPDDIIVVTDGLSISTASVFSKLVHGKIPIVGFGGVPGEPMASSYSVGNPVFGSYSQLLGMTSPPCDGSDGGAFPKFDDTASIAFSYAAQYESIEGETDHLAEFYREEPDYRLWMWDNSDSDAIYDAALKAVQNGDGIPK